MSNTGQVSSGLAGLREAANQVMHEEQERGHEGMIIAADQIARERGLESPLRGRSLENSYEKFFNDEAPPKCAPTAEYVKDEHTAVRKSNLSLSPPENSISPRQTVPQTESAAELELAEDMMDLFKEMKIKPKISRTVSIDDDVNELLTANREKKSKKASDERKSGDGHFARTLYLKRTAQQNRGEGSQNLNLNQTDQHRIGKKYQPETQMSKISRALNKFEETQRGQKVRSSFLSPAHELMLRSMKSTNHPSHSKKPPAQTRRPSSAPRGPRNSISGTLSGGEFKEGLPKYSSYGVGDYDNLRKSSDRLSRPHSAISLKQRAKDPSLRFSRYDDAKHCTFKPQIGKKKKESRSHNSDDEEKKEDPKYSFINRQEAEERNRREELKFAMGKADYDALVDKKKCPECGSKQSYDEVKEKRKNCPNCKAEYCYDVSWAKVSKRFFRNGAEYAARAERRRQEIEEKVYKEMSAKERIAYDRATGKLIAQKEESLSRKMTHQELDEFYRRMHEGQIKKKEDLVLLEKSVYSEYTFKPDVKKQSKKFLDDDDDDGDESDASNESNVVGKFLSRVEEDIEYRREKMPERYKPKMVYQKKDHDDDDNDFDMSFN